MENHTFVNWSTSNMIKHESGINIIDVFQHLVEIQIFLETDALLKSTFIILNIKLTRASIVYSLCILPLITWFLNLFINGLEKLSFNCFSSI